MFIVEKLANIHKALFLWLCHIEWPYFQRIAYDLGGFCTSGGGHGSGQHAGWSGTILLKVRPVVRYVGLGPTTVKKLYFRLIPIRARLDGSWAGPQAPFSLFFSLKLAKNNKKNNIKHGSVQREARARPTSSWAWAWAGLQTKFKNFWPGMAQLVIH